MARLTTVERAEHAYRKAEDALARIIKMEAAYKEMYERVHRLECVPEEQEPIPPYPKGTDPNPNKAAPTYTDLLSEVGSLKEINIKFKKMYDEKCIFFDKLEADLIPFAEAFSKGIQTKLNAALVDNVSLKSQIKKLQQENERLYVVIDDLHPMVSKMIELKKKLFGL